MQITDFLSRLKGVKGGNGKWTACCPAHDDKSPSLSVKLGMDERILLKCHAGCDNEAICAAIGLKLSDLFTDKREHDDNLHQTKQRGKIVEVYHYVDELGNPLFEVCRMEPKDFRHRRVVDGAHVWGRGDARLVLYNLPAVVKAETVWVVEGERDANTLIDLGHVATCNSGGAGKWIDGYTESLRGKKIILCGDTDEPGRKHVSLVLESVAGKVDSVTVVTVPGAKDIREYLERIDADKRKAALEKLISESPVFTKGISIPIQSMEELESEYIRFLSESKNSVFNLGAWLPSFSYYRPIVPGELVTLIADTGHGKTAIMQNIALAANPNPVLMFEIELPSPVMFERFVSIHHDVKQSQVEDEYREGQRAMLSGMSNVWTCTISQLTVQDIEKYIVQSALKIGRMPSLVMVDYIGLLQGIGNRYERLSDAAERLKVIAKKTKTIVMVASQIHRKSDDAPEEIFIHDAKDSGAIENSSQVVLGAWRDGSDPTGHTLIVKVLKYTRGRCGKKITCNFNGDTLRITERITAHELD